MFETAQWVEGSDAAHSLAQMAVRSAKGENRTKVLLTGSSAPGANQPLPFDHVRAHKLYAALFGEVQDLVNGKHLLIVPSGPLTQLPFQVLITKPPTSSDHREAAWLAREHAITVLPTVASLKALRRIGKPSIAPRPMVGFGNPLLDGPDVRYARPRQARPREAALSRDAPAAVWRHSLIFPEASAVCRLGQD